LHIALKEANETMYWLNVLYGSEFISKNQYDELMNDLDEIYKILFSSVKTAKEKLKS
jgi:four helix bundle protein